MNTMIKRLRRHIFSVILCIFWIPAWCIFIWGVLSLIDTQQTYDNWVSEQITSGVPTPTPTLDLGLMCKCSITFNTSFPESTFVYYQDKTNYATGYFIMDWGSRISSITFREYELTNLPVCEIVDLP